MGSDSKLKFSEIKLSKGSHASRDQGLCVMEAVAYFAGEEHSDRPACACPVITDFVIALNDLLPDSYRNRMKSYIPLIVGTRDGNEKERAEILAWKAIRIFAPLALREVDLPDLADRLAHFTGSLREASSAAEAAASAAWDAAYAVRDAASAAWDAAYAVRDAAEAAASAAWDAAYAAYAAYAAEVASKTPTISNKIYEELFKALDEILAVGRPDFSKVLNEIDELKKTLPGEPTFQKDAINNCREVFVPIFRGEGNGKQS